MSGCFGALWGEDRLRFGATSGYASGKERVKRMVADGVLATGRKSNV